MYYIMYSWQIPEVIRGSKAERVVPGGATSTTAATAAAAASAVAVPPSCSTVRRSKASMPRGPPLQFALLRPNISLVSFPSHDELSERPATRLVTRAFHDHPSH